MRRYATIDSDPRKSRKPSSERETYTSRGSEEDLLLLLTVDLGNDHLEQLPVHEGDDPVALAKTFCAKHKLPPHLCEVLSETIECNIRRHRAPSVSDHSSGDRTPNKTARPQGYAARAEALRPRHDFSRLQSVANKVKAMNSLVQRALNTKENITPRKDTKTGSQSTLKGHRRASSLAENSAETTKDTIKPTHLRERSDQIQTGRKSPLQSRPLPSASSSQVVAQIKNHRYAEIFRAIKSPEDTVLRADRIRTEFVHVGLINVIAPLLDELRDLGETLTLEEFQASMENLVAVLSRTEKNVLFYPFEIGDEREVTECTFKPQGPSSHIRSVSTVV